MGARLFLCHCVPPAPQCDAFFHWDRAIIGIDSGRGGTDLGDLSGYGVSAQRAGGLAGAACDGEALRAAGAAPPGAGRVGAGGRLWGAVHGASSTGRSGLFSPDGNGCPPGMGGLRPPGSISAAVSAVFHDLLYNGRRFHGGCPPFPGERRHRSAENAELESLFPYGRSVLSHLVGRVPRQRPPRGSRAAVWGACGIPGPRGVDHRSLRYGTHPHRQRNGTACADRLLGGAGAAVDGGRAGDSGL